MKTIIWIILMLSSLQAFERAEEHFEKKEYLAATNAFLMETRVNDPRVYAYLEHMHKNQLIDPDSLESELRVRWQQRLQHVPYAPQALGKGHIYLQMSLLAQDFYRENTDLLKSAKEAIERLCREHHLGFGFYIIARSQESKVNSKKKLKEIITTLENGVYYGESQALVALIRLAGTHTDSVKISKQSRQEYEVLKDHLSQLGEGEKWLSRIYAGMPHAPKYGSFKPDSYRKTYWQLQSVRQGDLELQVSLMVSGAERLQGEIPFVSRRPEEAMHWRYFAAIGGNLFAQTELGCCLMGVVKNSPFPVNCFEALTYFERVIAGSSPTEQKEKFYTDALFTAANILDKGTGGVPVDEPRALKYYRSVADLIDHADASFNTASMIDNGRGTASDAVAARRYFEKASKLGSGDASWHIATMIREGKPPYIKSLGLAYAYLIRGEKQENAECSYLLYGLVNHSLEGVQEEEYPIKKDPLEARNHLKLSAQRGYEPAQIQWVHNACPDMHTLPQDEAQLFVTCLHKGAKVDKLSKTLLAILREEGYRDLIPIDDKNALAGLQEAAAEGDELAHFCLGCAYEQGILGLDQSYELAAEHYSQSLTQAGSLVNLGFLKEKRLIGKRRDMTEVFDLYHQALRKNSGAAANNLGVLFQRGELVDEDHAQAIGFFKGGWELGDPDAAYQYARYLLEGKHCEQNPSLAREILSGLDATQPHVMYSLAADLMSRDPNTAWEQMASCAVMGYGWAEYVIGIQCYYHALNADRQSIELDDAVDWLKKASSHGVSVADSALRILQRNYQGHFRELGKVVNQLFMGDIPAAREIALEIRGKAREANFGKEEVNLSNDPYVQSLASRDTAAAQRRQEEHLEYFLDPLNRKSITVKDLEKIATTTMAERGGYSKSTKGSGKKLKVGDKVLGYHDMHRSGQSSRATLDPGRVSSFRRFATDVVHK